MRKETGQESLAADEPDVACTTISNSGSKDLASQEPLDDYRHNDAGEDNANGNLKQAIMGRGVVVAVSDGRSDFGPVGADLLRRIRRPSQIARGGQDHR